MELSHMDSGSNHGWAVDNQITMDHSSTILSRKTPSVSSQSECSSKTSGTEMRVGPSPHGLVLLPDPRDPSFDSTDLPNPWPQSESMKLNDQDETRLMRRIQLSFPPNGYYGNSALTKDVSIDVESHNPTSKSTTDHRLDLLRNPSASTFIPSYLLDDARHTFKHSSQHESPNSIEEDSLLRSQDAVQNTLNESTEPIDGMESSEEKPPNTLSPEPSANHPYHSIANYFSEQDGQSNGICLPNTTCNMITPSAGNWFGNQSLSSSLTCRDKSDNLWSNQIVGPFSTGTNRQELPNSVESLPLDSEFNADPEHSCHRIVPNSSCESDSNEFHRIPREDVCTETFVARDRASYFHESFAPNQPFEAHNIPLPAPYLAASPYTKVGMNTLDGSSNLHLPAWHHGHSQMSFRPHPGQSVELSNARRRNATRESTATLKAWLQEHIKNPYPTKGEKIMLAIITKMTLTQVSTWFANARRRLKKENKMTWTPKHRGEDTNDGEDDTDLIGSDDEFTPLDNDSTAVSPSDNRLEATSAEKHDEVYNDYPVQRESVIGLRDMTKPENTQLELNMSQRTSQKRILPDDVEHGYHPAGHEVQGWIDSNDRRLPPTIKPIWMPYTSNPPDIVPEMMSQPPHLTSAPFPCMHEFDAWRTGFLANGRTPFSEPFIPSTAPTGAVSIKTPCVDHYPPRASFLPNQSIPFSSPIPPFDIVRGDPGRSRCGQIEVRPYMDDRSVMISSHSNHSIQPYDGNVVVTATSSNNQVEFQSIINDTNSIEDIRPATGDSGEWLTHTAIGSNFDQRSYPDAIQNISPTGLQTTALSHNAGAILSRNIRINNSLPTHIPPTHGTLASMTTNPPSSDYHRSSTYLPDNYTQNDLRHSALTTCTPELPYLPADFSTVPSLHCISGTDAQFPLSF